MPGKGRDKQAEAIWERNGRATHSWASPRGHGCCCHRQQSPLSHFKHMQPHRRQKARFFLEKTSLATDRAHLKDARGGLFYQTIVSVGLKMASVFQHPAKARAQSPGSLTGAHVRKRKAMGTTRGVPCCGQDRACGGVTIFSPPSTVPNWGCSAG